MPAARVPQCRQQESLNAGSKSSSMPAVRVPQCRQQDSLNAGSKSPTMPTARVPQMPAARVPPCIWKGLIVIIVSYVNNKGIISSESIRCS